MGVDVVVMVENSRNIFLADFLDSMKKDEWGRLYCHSLSIDPEDTPWEEFEWEGKRYFSLIYGSPRYFRIFTKEYDLESKSYCDNREKRVRRIIQPILAGKDQPEQLIEDDVQYVEDLGLIKTKGQLRIANGIYREIIPRSLIYTTQLTISHEPAWYIVPDNGCLDMDKLLTAFQDFFRKHSEHWIDRFDYKEAGPQLLLQGFLQRIVNGGGRVEREYGIKIQIWGM